MWGRFLLWGALVAGGFGAGAVWEHRGPMPWPASLLGKSLAEQLKAARAETLAEARARDRAEQSAASWRQSWRGCNAARDRALARGASQVTSASADTRAASSEAYRNGVAAGRSLACNTEGSSADAATSLNPDPGGRPGVVGLQLDAEGDGADRQRRRAYVATGGVRP